MVAERGFGQSRRQSSDGRQKPEGLATKLEHEQAQEQPQKQKHRQDQKATKEAEAGGRTGKGVVDKVADVPPLTQGQCPDVPDTSEYSEEVSGAR